MIMVEDPPKGPFGLPADLLGGNLAMENVADGLGDQGLIPPVQQVVKSAQAGDAPPGKEEGQKPEKKIVQLHLEELA